MILPIGEARILDKPRDGNLAIRVRAQEDDSIDPIRIPLRQSQCPEIADRSAHQMDLAKVERIENALEHIGNEGLEFKGPVVNLRAQAPARTVQEQTSESG